MYEQLRARETEVLIIGGGSRKGAERLSARHKLPFPVLVDPDPDRAVYRRYGPVSVILAKKYDVLYNWPLIEEVSSSVRGLCVWLRGRMFLLFCVFLARLVVLCF